LLIPRIPEVIVNLNRDERNAEVFRAFSPTIGQLESITTFTTKVHSSSEAVRGALSPLRARLFNPLSTDESTAPEPLRTASPASRFECSSRETEIRAIAKRIEQLVLVDNYSLKEIALVVRELAAYSDTIARVFDEQSIPCTLQRRIPADVPAARGGVKLFELLIELGREGSGIKAVSGVADLIKSGYFRLSGNRTGFIAYPLQARGRTSVGRDRLPTRPRYNRSRSMECRRLSRGSRSWCRAEGGSQSARAN
jgi:hypothetical protein